MMGTNFGYIRYTSFPKKYLRKLYFESLNHIFFCLSVFYRLSLKNIDHTSHGYIKLKPSENIFC